MAPGLERRMLQTPIPIPDSPRAQRRPLLSAMDERPHGLMQPMRDALCETVINRVCTRRRGGRGIVTTDRLTPVT
jgi:hypothetical protein